MNKPLSAMTQIQIAFTLLVMRSRIEGFDSLGFNATRML